MAGLVMKLVCMMVIAAAVGEAAIQCSTVISNVSPCLAYVSGRGPLGGCCGGVRSLNSIARTTPDRQAVCGCLKSLAGAYKGVNLGKVAGLPRQCGVSIPYKISPSTDCSRVR